MQPPPATVGMPIDQPTSDSTTLGVKRFFHANETLVKIMSLVFAAAGFLRAQPKDDAVAVLQCLLIVVGLVIFARLWEDLPRGSAIPPIA
jgi:hypothetical protein